MTDTARTSDASDRAAKTDYDVLEPIRQRWSPRAFSGKPVESQKLLQVLEAARWAASSFNEQPWRFIVATKEQGEAYAKLLGCLREKNQDWAKTAPVLMISLAKKTFSKGGGTNHHAWHDLGMAVENLVLQATDLGLHVHQMAGIEADRVRKLYGVPDDFDPVTGLALGYVGDPAVLPDDLQEKERAPRSRKALSELVFGNGWGEGAGLVEAS